MIYSRGMIITNDCQLPLCDEPPVQHLLPVHLHQVLPHLAHQTTLHLLLHLYIMVDIFCASTKLTLTGVAFTYLGGGESLILTVPASLA